MWSSAGKQAKTRAIGVTEREPDGRSDIHHLWVLPSLLMRPPPLFYASPLVESYPDFYFIYSILTTPTLMPSRERRRPISESGSRANGQDKSHCPLLPVFGDVKGPLEFQVLLLVVIDEGGDSIVVAAGQHTGGCFFFVDCCGVGSVSFGSSPGRKRGAGGGGLSSHKGGIVHFLV